VPWLCGQRIRPVFQRSWVQFWVPQNFSFAALRRLRHLSKAPNTGDERLLGGRVVSVATLPVMVSRLGWGSRFKSDPRLNAAGSLLKPSGSLGSGRMETPRQPRSHLEDTSTLPVSLTDLWRQHGVPGHTPSRKIWEVKQDLIMGRRPSF